VAPGAVDPLETAILSRLVTNRARADPDRLSLIFENGDLPPERVRYRDLDLQGNRLAFEFRRAGLARGDRVAVMLRNHPEFVHALVANSRLAIATVPIDPRARGEKLRYFLTFAECAVLITADYVLADEEAARVVRETGIRTYALSTPEGRARGLSTPGWPSLNEVLEGPEREDVGHQAGGLADPFLLAYSSGTTGDPKAIVVAYDRMPLYQLIPPGFFGYRPDDVPYTGLSLTHGNALVVTLLPALTGAADHSVFSRWFTKTRLWDVCIEHGCTTWSNLGGIASAVYGEPPSPKDRAHRVRMVVSAGMPHELWVPFERRFGVRILEWYGTMEGAAFAYNPIGAGPVGSFGKPPEVLELAVVDEQDEPVPPGTIGELVGRPAGGSARLDYFKNEEASDRKTRGGWMHTGDMCWRDSDGWYYFAHRKEEGGIRRMGEFISEGFIRRVVLDHTDVLDVHVYGVPSRLGAPGESDVVVAVVVRDRERFDANDLFERCARELERSHQPDYVQVVDDLPKTASEKVQTRYLAAAFDPAAPGVHARPGATV
jgi:acyl-CoA synthetase (AMP-forming)/AMP-acid ligase II